MRSDREVMHQMGVQTRTRYAYVRTRTNASFNRYALLLGWHLAQGYAPRPRPLFAAAHRGIHHPYQTHRNHP